MKHYILITAFCLLCSFSCSIQDATPISYKSLNVYQADSIIVLYNSNNSFKNDAHKFWTIKDTTKWKNISGFFEYMLTDNEKYGISFMIKNFNGLKELSSRKDGTIKLLKLYSNIKVLEDPFISNLDTLSSPLHLRYIELLLANDTFISQLNDIQKDSLYFYLSEKASEKRKNPLVYQGYLLLDMSKSKRIKAMSDYFTIIYTPLRQEITAYIRDEVSSWVIFESTMDVLNNYNVILIDSASRTYNCHSYAWNISEGGATCWIDYGGINLSKYWTNDLYSSATQGNNYGYTRVYYSGDHSALSSYGTSYYTSKWGEGPLVRHAPTTVPASYTTNRTYYYAPAIIGPAYITLGNTYIYRIFPHIAEYANATYHWNFCDEEKGGYIVSSAADSVAIFFNQGGTFQISCSIENSQGTIVYSAFFEPLREYL